MDNIRVSQSLKSGLYVISVPIGNLQDITLRALDVLSRCDKIYCEDTRSTKKLLDLHHICIPQLVRCDDNTQNLLIETIITDIKISHKAIGFVSDAGTPLISDPGYPIIRELRVKNIPIFPIPGVSSAIAALSVSGLPSDSFCFKGFIPKKHSLRAEIIEEIKQAVYTYVFFERPERLQSFLLQAQLVMPQAECFIARELTKLHEEFIFGSIQDVLIRLETMNTKGEAVLVIKNISNTAETVDDIEEIIKMMMLQGKTSRDIRHHPQLTKLMSAKELYKIAEKYKIK